MYIKTDRLVLKPMHSKSRDALTELLTDGSVGMTYMVPDFQSRQEAETLADRLITFSHKAGRHMAGIYLREALIGILHETEVSGDRIEIGYAVLPAYRNQGYCTEALKGAVEYLFAEGFREVLAGAFEENPASVRVMVKSGMRKLERREEISYRGKVHNCVFYSVRREET